MALMFDSFDFRRVLYSWKGPDDVWEARDAPAQCNCGQEPRHRCWRRDPERELAL